MKWRVDRCGVHLCKLKQYPNFYPSTYQFGLALPSVMVFGLLLLLWLFTSSGGVGLTPFFRNMIGDRLGDFPFPVVGVTAPLLPTADSFSGDGEEPAPVAEFRLELARPTVVSKCLNLGIINKWEFLLRLFIRFKELFHWPQARSIVWGRGSEQKCQWPADPRCGEIVAVSGKREQDERTYFDSREVIN